MTASGLTLEGKDVLVIEGHSSITGEPAKVILRLVSDGVKTVTNLRPALSYWEAGASLQCGYKPAS